MSDIISRQAAIAAFKPYALYDSNRTNAEWVRRIELGLEELPSAEKHGKWIKMSDADGVYWACSECGEDLPRVSHYNPQFDLFPRLESIDKTNFCPTCGARMDGEE